MIVLVAGVRWNLNDVWICISFMAKVIEHFFIYTFLSKICYPIACLASRTEYAKYTVILIVYLREAACRNI
jgi:hypothetical protein